MAPTINYENIPARDYRSKMCFTISKVKNIFYTKKKEK